METNTHTETKLARQLRERKETRPYKETRGRPKLPPAEKKHLIHVSLPPDQYKRLHSLAHALKIPAPSILSTLSYGIVCSLHEIAKESTFKVPDSRSGREALMNHLLALIFKAHTSLEELEAELFPDAELMFTRGSDE